MSFSKINWLIDWIGLQRLIPTLFNFLGKKDCSNIDWKPILEFIWQQLPNKMYLPEKSLQYKTRKIETDFELLFIRLFSRHFWPGNYPIYMYAILYIKGNNATLHFFRVKFKSPQLCQTWGHQCNRYLAQINCISLQKCYR